MSCAVIGVGNPLMTDDGIGLEALRRLQVRWSLPPDVDLVDGGTWGMNLLHVFEEADAVILLDAIRAKVPPGSLVVLERDQLPRLFAHKLSPHQIDLQEILALLELRGTLPERIVAVGLCPDRVEMGVGLSEAAMAGMEAMEEATVERLRDWGYAASPADDEGLADGVWRPAVMATGPGS